jgi:hypothetical protein
VRQPLRAAAVAARYLGAAALLGVGLDHLEQYSTEHYSAIPTIGTLFALNFVSAALIAGALAAPVQRLPGRAGRIALPLLSAGGIGIAAGSLAGLLLSESTGLFGFMEVGYRPAIVLSIALELATIVLVTLHAFTAGRGLADRARPSGPRTGPPRRMHGMTPRPHRPARTAPPCLMTANPEPIDEQRHRADIAADEIISPADTVVVKPDPERSSP